MKPTILTFAACIAATPITAEQTRQLDAHVHGVSMLELAMEDGILEIALNAPGMDIVGFEYAPGSEADKDAVDAAVRAMLMPETILTLPDAAACRLTEVTAGLETGEEHDHEEEHDHAGHDDHDHDKEHDHGDHAEHEGDHAERGGNHTEFQARYVFACAHPEDLIRIGFPFFDRFPNAQKITAQFVTETGVGAAEISRDTPDLSLE